MTDRPQEWHFEELVVPEEIQVIRDALGLRFRRLDRTRWCQLTPAGQMVQSNWWSFTELLSIKGSLFEVVEDGEDA